MAARAAESHVGFDLSRDFKTLVEIHAAPEWLWSALVSAMVEGEWTVGLSPMSSEAVAGSGRV
jgi:hypothetical protein